MGADITAYRILVKTFFGNHSLEMPKGLREVHRRS